MIVYGSTEFVEENPATIEAFRAALEETLQLAQSDLDLVRGVLPDTMGMPEEVASTLEHDHYDAELDVEGVHAICELMVKLALLNPNQMWQILSPIRLPANESCVLSPMDFGDNTQLSGIRGLRTNHEHLAYSCSALCERLARVICTATTIRRIPASSAPRAKAKKFELVPSPMANSRPPT